MLREKEKDCNPIFNCAIRPSEYHAVGRGASGDLYGGNLSTLVREIRPNENQDIAGNWKCGAVDACGGTDVWLVFPVFDLGGIIDIAGRR